MDLLLDESQIVPEEINELQASYLKKKKKLPMNIVEFVIGAILLVFCINYLVDHPAEKSSIISGIEVLYQKARIFTSQLTAGK
ncbi:MAG: hypothetical protein H6765_10300 [Candidatus Peribacteria bacterium]|nr:MAG: hypothetical protein H6765_10300 [Candidatus Peribacteria bacterium]